MITSQPIGCATPSPAPRFPERTSDKYAGEIPHFAAIDRILFLPIRALNLLRNSVSLISAMKCVYHHAVANASIFLLTAYLGKGVVAQYKAFFWEKG
jgi:hypothetical protein